MHEGLTAMNAERFEALAAAYGGQIRRWPEEERGPAAIFAESETGSAILARAQGLDSLLDAYVVKGPGSALTARVLASATRHNSLRRQIRLVLAALGAIGIGLAGGLAGVTTVTLVAPRIMPDSGYLLSSNTTAFGDIDTDADATQEDL
jgi:hypothetical protein